MIFITHHQILSLSLHPKVHQGFQVQKYKTNDQKKQ